MLSLAVSTPHAGRRVPFVVQATLCCIISVHLNQHNGAPFQAESGNNNNAPKAYLNVSEASNLIGICERTLRDLIARREIRTARIGRRVILRRVDLDAFLESQTV